MTRSDLINELAEALSKAQGEMEHAKKDSANPYFKSKYADLASIDNVIKGPFSRNGLAYTQPVETGEDGRTYVHTIILHKSGQWIAGRMLVKTVKDDMQALGSGISYARRYGIQALAAVPAYDDDGEAAVGRRPGEKLKIERLEKAVTVEDMLRLLGKGQSNGWKTTEMQKYCLTLGYPEVKIGLPIVSELDLKDLDETFGQPRKAIT